MQKQLASQNVQVVKLEEFQVATLCYRIFYTLVLVLVGPTILYIKVPITKNRRSKEGGKRNSLF